MSNKDKGDLTDVDSVTELEDGLHVEMEELANSPMVLEVRNAE